MAHALIDSINSCTAGLVNLLKGVTLLTAEVSTRIYGTDIIILTCTDFPTVTVHYQEVDDIQISTGHINNLFTYYIRGYIDPYLEPSEVERQRVVISGSIRQALQSAEAIQNSLWSDIKLMKLENNYMKSEDNYISKLVVEQPIIIEKEMIRPDRL